MPNIVWQLAVGLKVKLCVFVLYLPTHLLPPYTKNILHFHEEFFYRWQPKRLLVYRDSVIVFLSTKLEFFIRTNDIISVFNTLSNLHHIGHSMWS